MTVAQTEFESEKINEVYQWEWQHRSAIDTKQPWWENADSEFDASTFAIGKFGTGIVRSRKLVTRTRQFADGSFSSETLGSPWFEKEQDTFD